MKRFLMAALIAALGVGFVATNVEAKRLGGGMSQGMKRQAPPPAAPHQQAPAQNATPAATPGATAAAPGAAAAAATPKRSWMGPLAGLAAGLGLAALFSHLGMGAEFGSLLMMVLLAVVAFVVIRMVMARMRGAQPAAAGAGAGFGNAGSTPFGGFNAQRTNEAAPLNGAAGGAAAATGAGAAALSAVPAAPTYERRLPDGFDAHGFERIAKLIFIRMQAANDVGNLDDLRQFSTPEMFAAFRLDLQDRKADTQQTDVVRLDAEVIDYAEEEGKQIISVRFHGLLREDVGAPAAPFDETWHLVKPADGSSTQWLIAGIAQNEMV